jgi:hypothetical protein
MKIHSICTVKNEADVIGYCLHEALKWSDFIYVYDGESTDGTWDVVKALAGDRVVAWKQDGKTFQESLRAEVFQAFRDRAAPGDWWCHLDADEFYVTDPREFLRAVPVRYHVVWGNMVEYYLTDEDVRTTDFSRPVEERLPKLRYYAVTNSEPRFFRHRPRLQWPVSVGWPIHMGVAAPQRIFFRHYKYRSPEQIQIRLSTRQANRARGFSGWVNSVQSDWREKIVDPKTLSEDRGDGTFVVDEAKLGSHLESLPKRWAKMLMHSLGLWA